MPHYLDNIWGDQATIRGFGDALNSNMAALVEARARMRQQEQNAALNAAYYALERQKFQNQQPYQDALTREAEARAQAERLQNQATIQHMGDLRNVQQAAMQRYLQMNPPMQREMVPSSPQGVPPAPGIMASPQTQAMMVPPPQPQQGPVFAPTAPTMENLGRMNEATLRGFPYAQAAQQPSTALGLLQGQQLRPGDVPVNLLTGQQGQQIPGFVTPQQQFEQMYKMQLLDNLMRHQAVTEQQGQERIDKPPKETLAEKLLHEAQERRRQGGGASTATPGQRNRQVAVDKNGNKIVSYDNWATYQPLNEGQ